MSVFFSENRHWKSRRWHKNELYHFWQRFLLKLIHSLGANLENAPVQ